MHVIHLPDDIFARNKEKPAEIIFYSYSSCEKAFNRKSILNKNAISLVISGTKTMHFAERKVEVRDDEFHFLSAGNCLVSMKLSVEIPFKSILIFFDDSVLSNFLLKYNHKIVEIKNKTAGAEPYLAFKKDAFVQHFITSLNLLLQTDSQISTEMKLIKFEELVLYLLEKFPEQILSFQIQKNKTFDDFAIRKTVETNITNNISVEEMAFLCNISTSTFKRRFFKLYGTSPNKWMLKKRMELAKNMLLHQNEKPSDIFYKIGYQNHSSFSHSFKQVFGTTPKAFQMHYLNVDQQLLTVMH